MERKKLAPGVFITTLDAEKFNRCRITIHLRYPALRRSATDAAVLPLVLESGSITVKLDDTQQVVSGTPMNDKLFGFFKKYQQIQNQLRELVHKQNC